MLDAPSGNFELHYLKGEKGRLAKWQLPLRALSQIRMHITVTDTFSPKLPMLGALRKVQSSFLAKCGKLERRTSFLSGQHHICIVSLRNGTIARDFTTW